MKIAKTLFVVLGLALLVGVLVSPARADQWNKETVLTFSQPVEIPGKVLPAGTYVFKLLDSYSWRHIVQVFNADKTEVLATILAILSAHFRFADNTGVSISSSITLVAGCNVE